ncbi:type I restriction endonuclease subunit R, EcoR124 family [Aquipseudomonas alcaligenes]|uniref:type I restriction endonuclease subunit R, EcoR124 family n=1 Tax=Aquipseudomonas alcaligenes TaxID=43263 RepID=UPI00311A7752
MHPLESRAEISAHLGEAESEECLDQSARDVGQAQELISAENLNAEAARRYIATSLKREFASDSGTELNAVLPKMSPLNPQYLTKKQSVFQKIAAFVEKFKGVGGAI